MSKAVMISIQPKWVVKILNGEKTIEVRKTAPKLETPFKVYIYMTQGKLKDLDSYSTWIYENRQKVVAEFTCYFIWHYYRIPTLERRYEDGICRGTCLTMDEIKKYLSDKDEYYQWHISDLKIYDKPRELGEFKSVKCIRGYHKPNESKTERLMHASRVEVKVLTRPFQSWGYVEEIE